MCQNYRGDLAHTELDPDGSGIEYRLYVSLEGDVPVRGNALASGDDAEDKEAEEEIERRLENGDVWAWASVLCQAKYKEYEGVDTLGGCSYKDTADFITPGGYWDDMKAEARADLLRQLERAAERLSELAGKRKK